MTVTQFGAIVGPLLAGVLLNWVNLSALYLIDAATCVLPIYVTFRLATMPAIRTAGDADDTPRWGVGAVVAGFRYLGGNTVVLMSLVVDLIAMVLGKPRALFPQMAHESYGGPLQGGTVVALLSAAMSVGAVAGAADMVSSAFRSTILQQSASDDLRGRLQDVFIVVVGGGPWLADAAHVPARPWSARRRRWSGVASWSSSAS